MVRNDSVHITENFFEQFPEILNDLGQELLGKWLSNKNFQTRPFETRRELSQVIEFFDTHWFGDQSFDKTAHSVLRVALTPKISRVNQISIFTSGWFVGTIPYT